MSETYEIRLRKEFELLQKLQRHPNVNNSTIRITVEYKERLNGKIFKSVLETPTCPVYPNSFRVTYKMPMYVGEGQLKNDWQATFLFSVSEKTLMDPNSELGVEIEGDNFPGGSIPYNNHISKGWVCTGTAWSVANQGFGIWYFIISLGCLFNQEKFIMVYRIEDDPQYKLHHLNYDAFLYWKDVRKMQPNNKIDWPFNLIDIGDKFGKKSSGGFSFGDKKVTEAPKSSFSFGEKKTVEQPKPTFTFGAKK
jgi:hypothetical protein